MVFDFFRLFHMRERADADAFAAYIRDFFPLLRFVFFKKLSVTGEPVELALFQHLCRTDLEAETAPSV